MSDVLIVFFSRSNSTKEVAKIIQEKVGGDIFEVIPEKPYPEDYRECTDIVRKEKSKGMTRPYKGDIDIAKYNRIFIGSPVWWGSMASPLKTFFSNHDFTGKRIFPFCTHGGGKEGNVFNEMKSDAPKATISEGLVIAHQASQRCQSEVEQWIAKVL